jgi:hypothetical protein
MTGYYDYVLGLIPLALFGLSGTLHVAGLGITQAVPIAAGLAALIVGHALFVNGPVSKAAVKTVESATEPRSHTNPSAPVDAD